MRLRILQQQWSTVNRNRNRNQFNHFDSIFYSRILLFLACLLNSVTDGDKSAVHFSTGDDASFETIPLDVTTTAPQRTSNDLDAKITFHGGDFIVDERQLQPNGNICDLERRTSKDSRKHKKRELCTASIGKLPEFDNITGFVYLENQEKLVVVVDSFKMHIIKFDVKRRKRNRQRSPYKCSARITNTCDLENHLSDISLGSDGNLYALFDEAENSSFVGQYSTMCEKLPTSRNTALRKVQVDPGSRPHTTIATSPDLRTVWTGSGSRTIPSENAPVSFVYEVDVASNKTVGSYVYLFDHDIPDPCLLRGGEVSEVASVDFLSLNSLGKTLVLESRTLAVNGTTALDEIYVYESAKLYMVDFNNHLNFCGLRAGEDALSYINDEDYMKLFLPKKRLIWQLDEDFVVIANDSNNKSYKGPQGAVTRMGTKRIGDSLIYVHRDSDSDKPKLRFAVYDLKTEYDDDDDVGCDLCEEANGLLDRLDYCEDDAPFGTDVFDEIRKRARKLANKWCDKKKKCDKFETYMHEICSYLTGYSPCEPPLDTPPLGTPPTLHPTVTFTAEWSACSESLQLSINETYECWECTCDDSMRVLAADDGGGGGDMTCSGGHDGYCT